MKKAKASKPQKQATKPQAKAEKSAKDKIIEQISDKEPEDHLEETRDNTALDTPSDGRHAAHDPAEAKTPEPQIETDKPKDEVQGPPAPPDTKPTITYEVLESTGTDDQFEYVRVNVKVNPPFNGFDEAIITVPCPIHNSKGHQKKGDREQLIKEKALWKVNSYVGQGAHQFNAEDVKEA